jgi:Leucine-rich repeat (LRR) protein
MDPLSLLRSATNARYKHLEEGFDPKEPAKALTAVTYLSLDHKGLEFIENLDLCVNLSVLYLSDNRIRSLKSAFLGHSFKNLV